MSLTDCLFSNGRHFYNKPVNKSQAILSADTQMNNISVLLWNYSTWTVNQLLVNDYWLFLVLLPDSVHCDD